MKLLPLTQGKFAEVDDEDFNRLSQWKWRLGVDRSKDGKIVNYYGQRTIYLGGETPKTTGTTKQGRRYQQVITLGKEVMGIPTDRKLRVDHIDGDKLNVQKSNLRIATVSQINYGLQITSRGKADVTSKYIGVSHKVGKERVVEDKKGKNARLFIRKEEHSWRAAIREKGRPLKIEKNFPFTPEGEIQAGKWYDAMARRIHGSFAVLNFPKKEDGGNINNFTYEIGGL